MKNLQLGISAGVVIAAGLVYGFNPKGVLGILLEIQVTDLELRNIFKAVMGLYLALGFSGSLGFLIPPIGKWRPFQMSFLWEGWHLAEGLV